MKRVYAEIGLGNGSFLSTEIEENGKEYRISEFIKPQKIDDYYLRIWVLKRIFIFSTKDGLKTSRKDINKFKIVLGFGGFVV